MISRVSDVLHRARKTIRLREPQSVVIISGAPREAIDATYDGANRLVNLVVHTRQRSMTERIAPFARRR